ncbi:MAG: SGNH/GDSL hydrolase family protein [Planctomycetes bacterium]|nr:SGNH/GDSL hydrolase family protein [Planctomycetota bacterium]
MTFLALGDSYTIGEGVEAGHRWPAQLAATLRAAGTVIADPVIVARTGWTTRDLLSALAAKPPGRFSLVTIQIGVNDQFRGVAEETYDRDFSEALELAITYAGDRPGSVVVLSIPDYSVTPFAARLDRTRIATQIDRFNAINRRIAKARGASYVDVTASSRESGGDTRMLTADALHPSHRMYERWIPLIREEALAASVPTAPQK